MAQVASMAKACCMNFNEKYLTSAICFEAERGYRNAFGRNMRFSNFLQSNLLKLCSRSYHKSAQRLLEEVNGYGTASMSDRSKLLNKVSVLMGYCNVQDLIEHVKAGRVSDDLEGDVDDVDISLARRRFPSIILGSSSLVQLYDDNACQPDQMGLLLAENCGGFLLSSIGSYYILPFLSQSTALEAKGKSDAIHVEEAEGKSDVVNVEANMKDSSINAGGTAQQIETSSELIFDRPISCTPGISTRHCRQLEKSGFHTMRKLLHHFPRTYCDLKNARGAIDDGDYLIFAGKVLSSRGIKAGFSFSFLEVVVGCEFASDEGTSEVESDDCVIGESKMIYLHLKKFFRGTRFTSQPFLTSIESKHKEGDLVYVSGKVREMKKKDHYEMREYTVDKLEEEEESSAHGEGRPYPVYPSKGGLLPSFLRDIISRALQALSMNIDPIPDNICEEFGLLRLYDAYMGIHRPRDLEEADLARRRLVFDEFFYLQLGRLFQMLEVLGTRIEKDGLLDKYRNHEPTAISMDGWSSLTKKLLKALPYSLTPSQLNAVSEIIWDLKRPIPMNRLLQGDVGCGKTVVAFLACMEVIGSGFQAAFMVPTELLAIQHYEHFLGLIENLDMEECKPSIALLTGSTPTKQSRVIRKGLHSGDIALVIGTHSLITDSVEFAALRIAVVDEQHRFGVIQRGMFSKVNRTLMVQLYSVSSNFRTSATSWNESSTEKAYMAPHILSMSATPIPRTLALALYGDMSLTQITDLPPGRKPVETFVLEGNESGFEDVYQMMREELLREGKVYLVYPVIEESEQLPQLHAAAADLESISAKFEDYQCGLLHGRMKSDEKDEALRRFRSGETHILLSTQVIEIGVDVPDASMMVVMNAERFGIAQLHQLRGRVGRGTKKSKCVFLASSSGALNRLKVLEKSCDGFYLANMDLMLRGPGNLLGKKQSGHLPDFPIARLEIDGNILQEAHLAALKILSASHDLESFPKLKAELSMRQPLCLLGD
ncbi:ATP-dependent DNA helicase homolog RECG, chloroplastic isoform X5 [Magnolia sinica]|uniref:ATP-dependent DNA helicase homolog RECG, chloroplastic isoform X5 n=1 Tax=Magnolia sinica TaxID=86752 RepID=UPI0026591A8C|nr:ATP-dependent DNA helicase homolog RECG, chloroplastic isoform X5 [Magnolia sinica]